MTESTPLEFWEYKWGTADDPSAMTEDLNKQGKDRWECYATYVTTWLEAPEDEISVSHDCHWFFLKRRVVKMRSNGDIEEAMAVEEVQVNERPG